MDDLPESLLMDVLLRLPLVALHRFKVVCKKWRSLIFTPYFLGEYNSHSSRGSISPRWAFVSRKEYYCSEIHDDPVEAHELLIDLHSGDLKCPIPNRSNDELLMCGYRIKGVSNGLVLYQWWSIYPRNEEHRLHWGVCNPVTRQYVVLPRGISEHTWRDICGFLTRIEDGVVTSFTVVKYGIELCEFEVFSSETGEWKLSRAYSSPEPFFMNRTPTDFGGILHWILCSYSSGIVAFDPSRNNCRVFPAPAAVGPCRQMGICGTHDGHLRYVDFDGQRQSLRVWVLNDYGRGDNWLLQHRGTTDILQDVHLDYCKAWEIRKELKLICFHPFDPDVVYLGCHYVFLSYNLREGKSQVLKIFDVLRDDGSWEFTWSRAFCLVIPPLPPLIPFVVSPREPRE